MARKFGFGHAEDVTSTKLSDDIFLFPNYWQALAAILAADRERTGR